MKIERDARVRSLLLDGEQTSVWMQTLLPGDETPWHEHRCVTDNFVVGEGIIAVDTDGRNSRDELKTGGFFAVKPGTTHRVRNVGDRPATLITVQTGGRRDFIVAEDLETGGGER